MPMLFVEKLNRLSPKRVRHHLTSKEHKRTLLAAKIIASQPIQMPKEVFKSMTSLQFDGNNN